MTQPFGKVIPVSGPYLGFPGKISRLGKRTVAARPVYNAVPTVGQPGVSKAIPFGAAVIIQPDSVALSTGPTGGAYQSAADFEDTTIVGNGTITAALFAGIAIAEVLTTGPHSSYLQPADPLTGSYLPGLMCEVLEEGTIVVQILVGTPVGGAAVYIRKALNGSYPAGVVGGLEASVGDSSNTVALTGVVFRTGILDANNMCEITLLNRIAA